MKTMNVVRLLVLTLVTTLAVAFTSPAIANDETKTIPVEMKYVGKMHDQPLFYLNFLGATESQFTILIRDQYGNVLYKDIVKGSQFTKKFLINTEELGDAELTFEVSSRSYEKPVVFEINKSSRLVEDLVVTKVK